MMNDLKDTGLSDEKIEEIEKLASEISGGFWNYRLIRYDDTIIYPDDTIEKVHKYEIHEVYYTNEGNPWSISENPLSAEITNYEDAKYILKEIKKVLKRTVLVFNDNKEECFLKDSGKYLKDFKDE